MDECVVQADTGGVALRDRVKAAMLEYLYVQPSLGARWEMMCRAVVVKFYDYTNDVALTDAIRWVLRSFTRAEVRGRGDTWFHLTTPQWLRMTASRQQCSATSTASPITRHTGEISSTR